MITTTNNKTNLASDSRPRIDVEIHVYDMTQGRFIFLATEAPHNAE